LDISVKDYMSAELAIRNFLSGPHPPDAIFTLKNSTTIYAFEALQKLNVPVPGVVALLGYDDFELASTVRPSISVIQQPAEEIGTLATELLFKQLLDGAPVLAQVGNKTMQQVRLETRLIIRSSCGCQP
jgi:LacI family transcriptional regulator